MRQSRDNSELSLTELVKKHVEELPPLVGYSKRFYDKWLFGRDGGKPTAPVPVKK